MSVQTGVRTKPTLSLGPRLHSKVDAVTLDQPHCPEQAFPSPMAWAPCRAAMHTPVGQSGGATQPSVALVTGSGASNHLSED